MSTLLCAETNAVVKLDLGEKGGTRRIVFSRLWDSEKSQVAFKRLVNFAFRHSTLLRPDLHDAIVTYSDVDGDRITISTPHELQEAFEQFITYPSNTGVTPVVLRTQVTFVKGQKCVAQKRMERKCMANVAMQRRAKNNSEEKSSEDKSAEDKSAEGKSAEDKFMMNLDRNNGGRNCNKWVQMKHALDSLVTNMTETVEKMANDYENGNKTNLEIQTVIESLVTNMKATVEKLSEDVGLMQQRKRIGVSIDDEVVDSYDTDKPFNRANGRKRRNLKMQGMLDSFVTDMTQTIQKLSDLPEEKSGNNVDNTYSINKDQVSNSEGTKTATPGIDAYDYYCSVVGSPEPLTEDVAEVIMAERVIATTEVGKVESVVSMVKPSGSANDHTPSANDGPTRDVDMAGNVTWEVVP